MRKRTAKDKPCSIEGCQNGGYKTRGWCHKHYMRWYKHGDPLGGGRRYSSSEESFDARTEWQGDCLIWTGATSTEGYGLIRAAGRMMLAHRYAYERQDGPIPDGMELDHMCHNTSCCNVEHLRLATRKENGSNMSGAHRNNRSGVRNVSRTRSGTYAVRVQYDGKANYFGSFPTLEEAAIVAEQKRKELFGEFAGKG